MEALHKAHFTDGLDIASHDVLADVAARFGFDRQRGPRLPRIRGRRRRGERGASTTPSELGISSVPTFVFANKYAMSGAADPANLLEVMREVQRREAASENAGSL